MQARNAGQFPASLKRIDCVNTLIRRDAVMGPEVLLVWNADWRPPGWSFPGGARECAESLTEAACREVREETGLEVELQRLVDVHERIGLGGRVHLVVFTFSGLITGGSLIEDGRGEPECGGVSCARWVPISEAREEPKVGRVLGAVSAAEAGATCTCDRMAQDLRRAAAGSLR